MDQNVEKNVENVNAFLIIIFNNSEIRAKSSFIFKKTHDFVYI